MTDAPGARPGAEPPERARHDPAGAHDRSGDALPDDDRPAHDRPAPADATGPAATPAMPAGTIVIEDGVIPRRVRRPFDLVRALTAVAAIILIVAVTFFLTGTTTGVESDINGVGQLLPDVLKVVVTILAGFGILGLPLAVTVDLLIRRRPRQLLDVFVASAIAAALAIGLSVLIQHFGSVQLLIALTGQTLRDGRVPVDPVFAALAAMVTVARLVGRDRWGSIAVIIVTAICLAQLLSGGTSAATVALSLLLGWTVGLLTRYAVGTPTTRPSGLEVAATMESAGYPLSVLRAWRETARGRSYQARTTSGELLRVKVLDRDREGAGLLSYAWRQLQLRDDSSGSLGFSMHGVLDHSALLTYAAESVGAPTPRLVLVSGVGPDAALLVYESVAGHTLDDLDPAHITESDLESAFRAVKTLHDNQIAHRTLSADQLLRTADGTIWLTGIEQGAIAASDVQRRIDLAELLCTLGLLVGADRTIAAGTKVLGSDRLSLAMPALQPVAMSRTTRKAMRGNKKLLIDLRDGLVSAAPSVAETAPLDLRRVKLRTLITVVLGLVAGYVLLGQLTTYNIITLFGSARWDWVLVAFALAFLSFVGAALSLSGFVPEKLSHIRTFAAQLAAGFATLVSPPTVGTVAVNVRYLQKSGLHPALASASVGVSQVFAFGLHISLLFGFGLAAGSQHSLAIEPPKWAIVAVIVLVALAAIAFAFGPVRRIVSERVRPILKEVGPRLVTIAQRPWKIVEGAGGILLLNAAFCLCMVASVHAFGGDGNVAAISIVYLAGSTLGQAAPTPGGIGAVEAVYVAGLTAAGVEASVALSATFLFRAVTFYLPTIPGYLCFNWLQRVGAL
ncbi:MAG TPA: lysylphosphatidylglycerol synthase transmembrane domain-containing protein [Candidatus Nanopelagicales bacterium]|jgi:uncharacterized protein (TIRG00374 family)